MLYVLPDGPEAVPRVGRRASYAAAPERRAHRGADPLRPPPRPRRGSRATSRRSSLKALRKEPEQRYASAGELADDIGRFLDGRRSRPAPTRSGYRARKFVDATPGRRGGGGAWPRSRSPRRLAALALPAPAGRPRRTGAIRGAAGRRRATALAVLPFKPLVARRWGRRARSSAWRTRSSRSSAACRASPCGRSGAVAGALRRADDAVQPGRAAARGRGRGREPPAASTIGSGSRSGSSTSETAERSGARRSTRRHTDVFAVEDAIARRVAEALDARTSSPEARARLARRGTETSSRTTPISRAATSGIGEPRPTSARRSATSTGDRRRPGYALAYSGLADCYSLLSVWGGGAAARDARRGARRRAARRGARDDAPGRGLRVGRVRPVDLRLGLGRRGPRVPARDRAESGLRDGGPVVRVLPRVAAAASTRRSSQIRRAQELDPLSVSIATDVGEILCWAGRYDEAIAAAPERRSTWSPTSRSRTTSWGSRT